jgi:hypothetical protein
MEIPKIKQVTTFIDWNSQIHATGIRGRGEEFLAEKTLDLVGRRIGRALSKIAPSYRFNVALRVYHGWHKGFEKTVRRKALITAAARADFAALSCKASVSIRRDIEYGDRLFSALQCRLHDRIGSHLPNTLRDRGGMPEEKMVDTAIASDIVDHAHREPDRWLLAMGEDDDLIPPLFVAESAVSAAGGKVILVRGRSGEPFFKLENIWCEA